MSSSFAVVVVPAPPLVERSSPFLETEPSSLDRLLAAHQTSLLSDLIRAPAAVVERLLDQSRLAAMVQLCLALVTVGTWSVALLGMGLADPAELARACLVAPLAVLAAMAAALGPIYAVSVMLAARLPWARLVGATLAAGAVSSMVLAGAAPLMLRAWAADRHWAGPIALMSVFALAALAGGLRLHSLLQLLAREQAMRRGSTLEPEAAFRVGIVARVSTMLLGFTLSVAVWASVLMVLG